MDMSVSPDLEAFCCYGIVLILGLVAARVQISNKLQNLPGKWIMGSTWLLYFAYSLIPVALFGFSIAPMPSMTPRCSLQFWLALAISRYLLAN